MARGQTIIDSEFLEKEGEICGKTAELLENARSEISHIIAFTSPVYGTAAQQQLLNAAMKKILSKIAALQGSMERLQKCVLGFNNQFLDFSDANEEVAHLNRDSMRNTSGISGDEGGGLLVTHVPEQSSVPEVGDVIDNTGGNEEAKKTFGEVIQKTAEKIWNFIASIFGNIFGKKA